MANYQINISKGVGSKKVQAGTYNVTANITGYDATTLSPNTSTMGIDADTKTFTIAGGGTLKFTVNETGAQGGKNVTSGTIVMTNSSGTEQYGSPINIDGTGVAIFNYVPYGSDDSPFKLYFKQLTTDDSHNIEASIIEVDMIAQTKLQYIVNLPAPTQTINITDANYPGLNIGGEITFTSI